MRWPQILVIVVSLPLTAWSAEIHYALDVDIDPKTQILSGVARLQTAETQDLTLSVDNLSNLKVNNEAIITSAESIIVKVQKGQELVIDYKTVLNDKQVHFVDLENVFLVGGWYPQPNILVEYTFSVTLPTGFLATSETETVKVRDTAKTSTFMFEFHYPLRALNLAASKNYLFKTDNYKDIVIETYLFQETAQLADTYINNTKKYLALYEEMLTPYPYQRFAIVENIFPKSYSMPTYAAVGRIEVMQTTLQHEILHQWFGHSVFIDYDQGNWAEGITHYLADHYHALLEKRDNVYRKHIMLNYDAYVNNNNVIPVSAFQNHSDKSMTSIGYDKAMMIFHMLKQRYDNETFLKVLRNFIKNHLFRKTAWQDIQQAFETETKDDLSSYFAQWLDRKDIPHLTIESVELQTIQSQLTLSFNLIQQTTPYHLQLPITVYTATGKVQQIVEIKRKTEPVTLILEEAPTQVVLDENYDLMRQLLPKEIPPTLATLMGKEKVFVLISPQQRNLYQPLLEALKIKEVILIKSTPIPVTQFKKNSFIISGFDTPIIDTLFGKQALPELGVHIVVYKNPYNEQEVIALLHAKNAAEIKAVTQQLSHYGEHSVLSFTDGKNTKKALAKSNNGIVLLNDSQTDLQFSNNNTY